MPPKTEEQGSHPIVKAWRLRQELDEAINGQKWKRAHNIAKDLMRQIDVCLAHNKPHLDGLFRIGTMWYQTAPEKAARMIDRFNVKLKTAKGKLPK